MASKAAVVAGGLFAACGLAGASRDFVPSSLSRNLQAFDGQAAAKKIDYSSPHYGRDHTPGGQWDLLDEQSTQTAGRGGEERVLQGLAAEFTGLWLPTGVAQDGMGHVIICQKTGLVVIFDVAANGYFGAGGRVLIDIQSDVANYGDHGLTHVVYHEGYLWLTYSRETPGIGDNCLDDGAIDGRPLSQINGCEVHGRVVRFPYDAQTGQLTGGQEVIIEGRTGKTICGQFATHGATCIIVGPDNALYFSAGDGASYQGPDVGQFGNNPCNDPPGYLGGFRAQDPNRMTGKITRLDPQTLESRTYATGFRNPFRLTAWEGRLFESDTGWYNIEELNEVFEGKNYGWPCYEGDILQVDYQNFRHPTCEWLKSGGGGGNTAPLHFYHHPPGAVGNVMSISAIGGYNGRLYFGDFTTSEIYSLSPTGQDKQLVLRDCYPVGIYASPVGLLYIDYTRGAVRSLPAAGAPIPSPTSTPAPAWVKIIPQQQGWATNGAQLAFYADGQSGGREGNNFQWSVTYLQCFYPGSSDCLAANLFDRNDKQTLAINAPLIPVTLEVTIKRWTFAGAAQYDGVQIAANGTSLCSCPGQRTWVNPEALGADGNKGGSGGGGGGGLGGKEVTKSAGFIGGITAAASIIVIGVALAAAFYTGFLHRIGLLRDKKTRPHNGRGNNVVPPANNASSAATRNSSGARNEPSAVELQDRGSSSSSSDGANNSAAHVVAPAVTVTATAISELASRRPSFPSLAPVHVRSQDSGGSGPAATAAAATVPRRTPGQDAAGASTKPAAAACTSGSNKNGSAGGGAQGVQGQASGSGSEATGISSGVKGKQPSSATSRNRNTPQGGGV